MERAMLEYYSFNGDLKSVNEFIVPNEGKKFYEVIRIIEGVPLFMGMHIKRFESSLNISGIKSKYSLDEIQEGFYKVIKANGYREGNIKLILNYTEDSQKYYIFYIPHSYPSKELYAEGISTILFNGERANPNAKVINQGLRAAVDEALKEEKAYEALLVDTQGRITEGSKSNVFFVKNEVLITPPVELVLPGITRAQILDIANSNNICVEERYINKDELGEYDGAFISGTSPKVLPIKTVDSIKISSNNNFLVKKIMKLYDNNIENYIKNHKK